MGHDGYADETVRGPASIDVPLDAGDHPDLGETVEDPTIVPAQVPVGVVEGQP